MNGVQSITRTFYRGEVFMVNFGEEDTSGRTSYLLKGEHRVVVLFDSTYPRRTVVVIPITSRYDSSGREKTLLPSDIALLQAEYEEAAPEYKGTIRKDSFLMTNQIRSVTRDRLETFKGCLLPKHMMELDVKLIATLGLQSTLDVFIEWEVESRLREILAQYGIAYETEEASGI